MTLAVAALAIAAIFMSSSAGLLSRFYDREREYRLAATSALEIVTSRLTYDTALAIPDTGMRQVLTGYRVPNANGTTTTNVSVNVYAAVTGDTSGLTLPFVTLIAQAYDAGGTRHVRRADLRRESFSSYMLVADQFPADSTFGPGVVYGRVHTNGTWRSGPNAASAGAYRGEIRAVGGFSGTASYVDSASGGPRLHYPRDSTYSWMTSLASGANLSFAPVAGSGSGWVRGTRLEFVSFDADNDSTIEVGEGYARIFDLATGIDTSRIRVSLEPTQLSIIPTAYSAAWDSPIVQNQCGAFYLRSSRWHFVPVAIHRASWIEDLIQQTGGSNFPAVTSPTMNTMNDYDAEAVYTILNQTTARCFPAGSPYLMLAERMTNQFGAVTGTAADSIPFGVVTPSGGWPASTPDGYGGSDSTFTPRSRTCAISSGSSGRCSAGTRSDLGTWRAFGGTAVTGVSTAVRQSVELPYLWPYAPNGNPNSRGVMRATGGPLFVSGSLRGALTLVVDGAVYINESLTQVRSPADPATAPCADRFGLVAVGDVLVTDNGMLRARRVYRSLLGTQPVKQFGGTRNIELHGNFMSLTGKVGVERNGVAPPSAVECEVSGNSTNTTAGGCLWLTGGAVMRSFSPTHVGNNTGYRWRGSTDACQLTMNRPPFFPLTNRFDLVRTIEIAPARAGNPSAIRAILVALKGAAL